MDKSVDIAFVVLHYMVKDITVKCVETIKERIDTENYCIIIVDNASNNGTGVEITKKYENDKNVKVIINKSNLGFAKGNNVGYMYAKTYCNPDYIIMLNNDVFINNYDLKQCLDRKYLQCQFAVLGPLILTRDGKCNINPVRDTPIKRREVEKNIKMYKRILFLSKYHLLTVYTVLSNIIHSVINCVSTKKKSVKNYMLEKRNVQLHGCFWAFSRKFIEKFDGLDDRTFLYMEEDILYKHMLENKMLMIYCPDIVVYHEEDASTNSMYKKQKEKIKMTYSNYIESAQVLLNILKEYSN